MKRNSNLQIIQRLLELSKNQLDYSTYPKSFKEEYLWLSNILNAGLREAEIEFSEKFQKAVGEYKRNLVNEGKGFGWFHSSENLIWARTQFNQIHYAIYGDTYEELVFREELGDEAYKDLIMQINPTVLMTPEELKLHNEKCNEMVKEILAEILKEEKNEKRCDQ